MSGIAGLFHRDGAPVKKGLLQAFARFLSYCGPDAQEVWLGDSIGLSHAMLRTTRESVTERQPANLEGHFWITADARLDCRAQLESELERAGCRYHRPAADSELILQAYAAWGELCLQRLRGDFAFAIWDAPRKVLFCARDPIGIKPFYYAELDNAVLFSNTLNCVRLHPEVPSELNEAAVADFLLFGLNCDNSTTTFRDIRRLPPGHFLAASQEGLRTARYWAVPTDGCIRYRRAGDYIENFLSLLQAAVADRMRTDRVGILLSGGLDSSSIAATARELSRNSEETADLRAYTITYESLIPDRDEAHAREVAGFLQIPIQCLAMDGLQPFDRWNDPELSWPEPVDDPFFAGLFDQFRMIAADCRVAFSGEGMDNLMQFEMWPHVKYLLRNGHWGGVFTDVPRYLRLRQSIWPGIRRRIKGLFHKDSDAATFPRWFAPDFARRVGLEARWRERGGLRVSSDHPVAPKAHASLALPLWSRLFELQNPGVTRCPVEVRYPFLDLRIVNYILALPQFPWAFDKTLLRRAMARRLPESIRLRPKTSLAGDPLVEQVQRGGIERLNRVYWDEQANQYIDRTALAPLVGKMNSEEARTGVRPFCLNFWLQSARRAGYNLRAEARDA